MNTFTGKMDQDTAPEFIKAGDFFSANNMSTSTFLVPGAMSALPSSRAIAYTFPAGTNVILGVHEDRQTQSVIIFVYNALNNHRILQVVALDDSVVELAGGAGLTFDPMQRVHSCEVIDGKLLYWVDGRSDGTTFSGGALRKLNIEKSYTGENKLLSYEIYAGLPNSSQFLLGKEYVVSVWNNGSIIDSFTFESDGTYAGDPAGGLAWLYANINGDLSDYLTSELCDCKIAITMKDGGNYFTLTTDDSAILLVPVNHYIYDSLNIKYHHTIWGKYPPKCAPVPTYISSQEIEYNNVRNFCGQFRTRYIYDDNEASSWSGISIIPLNDNQVSLNAIRVDFTEDRINDPEWLSIIRFVEVAFRDGNDDVFRLIKRVPVCEIGTGTNYIDFLNDRHYTVLPSDDLSVSDATSQILMNDHGVPRGANAMKAISDEKGDTHIVVGGLRKGFECPECIDVDFPVETYQEDCLVDIIGTVEIINDPSFPTDDPNYADYQGGFFVYLAGTRYFALSENPADGTGDGSFIIRNVPKGKYSIRVAHYLCRYGNDAGPQFNVLNGVEWQKTSAPCIDVAGSLADNGVKSERILDLAVFSGSTFDLDTEVDFGTIQIQNAHSNIEEQVGFLAEVYVYDNFGLWTTVEDRVEAIAAENQKVRFYEIDRVDGAHEYIGGYVEVVGDHNGYAYAWLEITQPNAVRVYLPTFEPSLPSNVGPFFEPTDHLYKGTWKDIQEDTATDLFPLLFDNLWNFYNTNYTEDPYIFYMFNGDPIWTSEQRHTASSTVVDANGSPVANALVWMMQHGRPIRTNSLGGFTLSVFGFEGGNALGPKQDTYVTYENDQCGLYPEDPYPTGGMLDESFSLPMPLFTLDFSGGIIPIGRFLKSGGIYKMGIVYQDDFERTCGVVPVKTVHIPFHTQDGQFAQRRMRFEINSVPPSWATKYRIVRTKDGYYEKYAQLPIADAIYCTIPDGFNAPSPTSYGSGTATHILLQISVDASNLPVTTQTLLMFQSNNPDGYRAKLGDRVRYLLDENQDTVISNGILDVNVVGEYIDDDKYYVVITYDNIDAEIKPNWVFEFYTPRGIEDEIYYETGVCLDILDFGTNEPRHQGITQDQTYGPDLPATGEILSGDTYWYRRDYLLYGGLGYTFTPENPKIRLLDTMECEDIGRAFLYDPYAKEQFLFNMILVSGIYVPNSAVNNLSVFGSLDFINLNRTYGPIRRMVMAQNVLFVICEFKSLSIYIGKESVMDFSSQSLLGKSTQVLNIADDSIVEAGTVNPESVCVQDGRVYWWDLRNACPWMYGPSGTVDMRDTMVSYFRTIADERKPLERGFDIVSSGFDRKYRHWILSFQYKDTGRFVAPGRAIAFTESSSGWGFNLSESPIGIVSVGQTMYWIRQVPVIHKAYAGTGFLNFFATQYDGDVQFVANEKPFEIKDWLNIRVMAAKKVFSPLVEIFPCTEYPTGMASRIPAVHWAPYENQQFAAFLRDENDPHTQFASIANTIIRKATALNKGRYLKGGIARITIRINTPLQGNSIIFADTESAASNITR